MRDLTYTIKVEDAGANQKVEAFERTLGKAMATAEQDAAMVAKLEKQTTTLAATQGAAIVSTDKLAAASSVLASVGLTDAATATSALATAEVGATAATTAFGTAIQFVMSNLALVATGAAIVGAAIGKLAEWYEDWRLKAEHVAAKQDTINAAVKLGASHAITYADAIKYLGDQHARVLAQTPEVAAQRYLDSLSQQQRKAIDAAAADHAREEGLARLGIVMGTETDIQQKWTKAVHDAEEAARKHAAELKRAEEANERFRASVHSLTTDAVNARKGFGMIGQLMPGLTGDTAGWREELELLSSHGLPIVVEHLQKVGHEASVASNEFKKLREASFGGGLMDIFSGNFSSGFGQIGASLKASLDPKQIFSSMIGGGLSSLISGGIGLLGQGLAKLFTNPEKQINPIRDAFVEAAGGIGRLNERAHEAGVTLDHLLNARNPEAYKKAIEELNNAFQFQDKAVEDLNATVKKYGFSIEELGPALQRQNLDKQAQDIYHDWMVLTGAGIDNVVVAGKMADSVNAYIHAALKAGVEVPAALRPILQQYVDLGLLTDANGDKITDLAASGIVFSETMSAGFTRVVESVDKLTAAIRRFLGITEDAAEAVANFPTFPGVTTPLPPSVGGGPPPEVPGPPSVGGIGPYHTGGLVRAHRGLALDEVPIIAQTGEGVLNRGAMRRIGGGRALNALNAGGGVGTTVVNVTVYADGDINTPNARRQLARVVDQQVMQSIRFRSRGAA